MLANVYFHIVKVKLKAIKNEHFMEKVEIIFTIRNKKEEVFSLDVPNSSVSTYELLPSLQNLFDTVIRIELLQNVATCRKGCPVCCNQLVPLSIAEVFYLEGIYYTLPIDLQIKIKDKINNLVKVLDNNKIPFDLESIYKNPSFEEKYFKLGISCPFLENNECVIYLQRPFICREYYVTTPDSFCFDPYLNKNERIKFSFSPGVLLSKLCGSLYECSPLPIPLFYFLDWSNEYCFLREKKVSAIWFFEKLLNYLSKYYPNEKSNIQSIKWKYMVDENNNNIANIIDHYKNMEINQTDRYGISPLYAFISQKGGVLYREILLSMIKKGAFIQNGSIVPPVQEQKLLTRFANAENIRLLFELLKTRFRNMEESLILEIGSGEGYLRYLISLLNDDVMNSISGRIIETEPAKNIVETLISKGKYIIAAGIEDLKEYFGEDFTPMVISMNVLDLFSSEQLVIYLEIIKNLLKKDGLIVHIMSSAIHDNVFRDIINIYPNSLYLPYYLEGFIGVRITSTQCLIVNENPDYTKFFRNLSGLFTLNPDYYIKLATAADQWFHDHNDESTCLLLHEFTINKIKKAMNDNGYNVILDREIKSEKKIKMNDNQARIQGINQYRNNLGVILTEYQASIDPGMALEESRFYIIIGQKM